MAGLGWAGRVLGLRHGLKLGWAGLSWAGAGLGPWLGCAGLAGWATLKRKLVLSNMKRKLVYSLHRKTELPDGQKQQAISVYFFLEGLKFGVRV